MVLSVNVGWQLEARTGAQRRGSTAAERSEAVRWNRVLGASARFSCQPTFTDKTLSFAFLSFA
jgi:hypothetical protein